MTHPRFITCRRVHIAPWSLLAGFGAGINGEEKLASGTNIGQYMYTVVPPLSCSFDVVVEPIHPSGERGGVFVAGLFCLRTTSPRDSEVTAW